MNTTIALFRGINVGGKGRLPMKELVPVLEGVGLREIRTYIQSGNVVFRGPATDRGHLARTIGAAVRKSHGFEPAVLLINPGRLEKALQANPFPEGEAAGSTLHLGFLASVPPRPDLPGLERLRAPGERFLLKGDVFYLHAPDGIGRSKLANGAERLLGVPMTSRNWNTLSKLREMTR
jgi:uncharacterized protein (DUF1697 family)